jgi:hypothetical protein
VTFTTHTYGLWRALPYRERVRIALECEVLWDKDEAAAASMLWFERIALKDRGGERLIEEAHARMSRTNEASSGEKGEEEVCP